LYKRKTIPIGNVLTVYIGAGFDSILFIKNCIDIAVLFFCKAVDELLSKSQ
jgi:hypothetical protein